LADQYQINNYCINY